MVLCLDMASASLTKCHTSITSMNNSVNVVKVCQAFEDGQRNLCYNINFYSANLLVNPIEGALVHIFHANTDIRVREESPPERYDVF